MESSLSCKHCSKVCPNPDSLRNHSVRCRKNPARQVFACPTCGKEFSRKDNYGVHVSKKQCKNKHCKQCPETDCSFTYYFRTALISHMKSTHGKDLKAEETHTFQSHVEFMSWKHEIEKTTMSYYSLQTGEKMGIYSYYYCQHDGSSKSHLKGEAGQKKREPAFKGRMKTDMVCTSMIQVKKVDGQVHVTFHPTHSHAIDVADLKHQPLSVEMNDYINNQILLGVSPSKIRDRIRGDKFARHKRNEESSYDRNDFIQMKSLRERKRKLLSMADSLDPNDTTATLKLVNQLQSEEYDPVLIFKPAGADCLSGPASAKNLPNDVFMLGLQTAEQHSMMERCSREILVIDATHDMTQYGCQLLNIVGIDELNRGYPLAHCISNKMDENTLQHFFHAIAEKVPLEINCIITDDDPALINAARKGFQQDVKHILCLWHFKRTLQRQLHNKVRDATLCEDMFQHFCTLVDASTEVDFESILEGLLNKYAESPFMEYFKIHCEPKKEKWAKCYRKFHHKHVDTTMHVESFHNTLKTFYLKRKPNKRIETLVNLLFKVEEDFYARRQLNLISSKREHCRQLIDSRHKQSLALCSDKVSVVLENEHWKVSSQSTEEIVYDVYRCAPACTYPQMCFFHCTSPLCLDLCMHLYICTCMDESTLCKHIHKVHSMYLEKTRPHQLSTRDPNSPTQITSVEGEVPKSPGAHSIFIPTTLSSNSDAEPNSTQCQKISNLTQFDKLNAELSKYVHSENFPKDLLPHVKGVLSKLIAECASACNNNIQPTTTIPNMQPTQKRTSTEKLVCQALPPKKKKKAKKTKYPTAEIKRNITLGLTGGYSLDELNALVVEEEEEEE